MATPNNYDVYFGRGRGFFDNPGNKKWRKLIEENLERYEQTVKERKKFVALEIVNHMRNQNPPGRFLITDEKSNRLKEVGNEEAVKRCRAGFANLKKRQGTGKAIPDEDLDVKDLIERDLTEAEIQLALSEIDSSYEVAEGMASILNLVENVSLNHRGGNNVNLEDMVEEVVASGTIKTAIESLLKAKLKKRPKLEDDIEEAEEEEPNEARDGAGTKMTSADSALVYTSFEMEEIIPSLDIVQEKRLKKDREYTGSVLIGEAHGSGCMKYDDGRFAAGNFFNGKLHGQACLIFGDGSKYFGNFWNHKREGKGVYIYTDGSKYDGYFSRNKRHGQGRYVSAENNKTYVGGFKDGEFEGYGFVLAQNGEVEQSGRFENWELVEGSESSIN